MKKTILTLALGAALTGGYAQVYPSVSWTKNQGGSGADVNYGITTDAAGNVYTLGLFNGTADLDPGSGTFNVTSAGSADIYISKLDGNGNFVWGKAVGGTSFETPIGITVDASNNVIVCGTYGATVDFDPGSGSFNLTSAGASDGFVLKLDASGNFAWATSIGSTLNEAVNAVGTDGSGNVYAVGYFTGTIDFDPGPGTSNMTSAGGDDAFVIKYTSAGALTWVKKIGTTGGDHFNAIDVRANGYAYVGGYYGGTIAGGDMNPVNTFPITCAGSFDGILWQLTPAGVGDGGAVMGGAGDEQFTAVAVDELHSSLFIAGHYSGTITAPYNLTNSGGIDACLMRFRVGSNNGITSVLYSYGIGNAQAQDAKSLDVDADGNVYMGGTMNGTNIVDFDPRPFTSFVTGAGLDDGFLASYDSTGVPRFAFNIGNSGTDFVSNTLSVRNQSIYVGGGYSGTLDFDPSTGTSNMTPVGSYDGYAAKYYFCVAPATPISTTPTANLTICENTSATLTATGAGNGHISWYTAAVGGTYLGAGSPFTTAPLTSSTTIYIQDSTCTASNNRQAVNITVNPAPVMATGSSPDPATVCAGQQVTLVATGGTVTWSGGISNYVPFTPTATTTYTATGTGSNGCTSTVTVLVTVNPAPTLTVTSSPSNGSVCQGSSVTLTANGASTYSWSGGITNGVAFTPSASGTYTVTGTSVNGCTSTSTSSVTVNSNPTITISSYPTTPTLCYGDTIYLTGNGANTMSWSGPISDGDPFVPTATGTYTVTGTDANGCSGTASITVTVNARPTVTASSLPSNGTVCAGSNVTLNGGGASSYSWSGGVSDGVAFVPTASGTYTVTGTAANGCTNTATASVTVNALPNVSIIAVSTDLCAGSSTVLSGNGASSYSWTGGVVDGQPFTPTATATYTVTGTDANGCSNTATETVNVYALPTITVSSVPSNATVCVGDNITLNGAGATTYIWSGGISDGVAFTPTASGTYTVTGIDANGCSNTATQNVTVNALPTVGVTVTNSTVCAGSPTTLSGTGASTYTWTGGVINGQSFAPTSTDTYTVTGTDANGCSNTATQTVVVNTPPTADTASSNSACTSPTGSASVINVAGNGPFTYSWTGSSSTSSTANNLSAGVYVCTITDANGCSSPVTVIVSALNAPVATLQSVTNVSCFGGSDGGATVNATGGSGTYSYTWTNSSSTSNTISNVTAGTYTCTVTDAVSCQANLIVTITEPPALDNTVATSGMTLTSNETTAGATYQWVDCNNGNAPIAGATGVSYTATQPGSYAVIVTLNSCSVTSSCMTVIGIAGYDLANSINLYPNPNNGTFTVDAFAAGIMSVYDVTGNELMHQQISAGKNLVSLDSQSAGIYFVRIICGNTSTVHRVIVD